MRHDLKIKVAAAIYSVSGSEDAEGADAPPPYDRLAPTLKNLYENMAIAAFDVIKADKLR